MIVCFQGFSGAANLDSKFDHPNLVRDTSFLYFFKHLQTISCNLNLQNYIRWWNVIRILPNIANLASRYDC